MKLKKKKTFNERKNNQNGGRHVKYVNKQYNISFQVHLDEIEFFGHQENSWANTVM